MNDTQPPQLFNVDDPVIDKPVTPYSGTSGWSGSSTSQERAQREDTDGTTRGRQQATIDLLNEAGSSGLTWQELASRLGVHHGAASGVLSVLHKSGRITRLSERRNRCQVYVALNYVNGRPVEAYRPNVSTRQMLMMLADLARDLDDGHVVSARHKVGAWINVLKQQ